MSEVEAGDAGVLANRDPPFASAFSSNHFQDALDGLLPQLAARFPGRALLVVDLGLRQSQREKLASFAKLNISIRHFNFTAYPTWVGNLMEYRWKPLLIAELLRDFGSIFYMDAHIEWVTSDLRPIQSLLDCARSKDPRAQSDCHYPLLLPWPTGHSIFATTAPQLYAFLPIDGDGAKATEMACAGFQLVYGTADVKRLYKWAVLCALERNCMGPPGLPPRPTHCRIPQGKAAFETFLGCHRFDQSVFNILLANRHAFNRSKYALLFDVPPKNMRRPGEYRPSVFKP